MITATFAHVGVNCTDAISTERFYTHHFGFQRARVVPLGDRQIIFLKLGNTYLELFQADTTSPVPLPTQDGPTYPGWRHIAFQVDNVDAKLAEMGAEAQVQWGPLSFDEFIPGWRAAWIADPDGNIIEISQGYRDETNPSPLTANLPSETAVPVY